MYVYLYVYINIYICVSIYSFHTFYLTPGYYKKANSLFPLHEQIVKLVAKDMTRSVIQLENTDNRKLVRGSKVSLHNRNNLNLLMIAILLVIWVN